jgi:hypothetical protein
VITDWKALADLVADAAFARDVLRAQHERHGAVVALHAAEALDRAIDGVIKPGTWAPPVVRELPQQYCVDFGANLKWPVGDAAYPGRLIWVGSDYDERGR